MFVLCLSSWALYSLKSSTDPIRQTSKLDENLSQSEIIEVGVREFHGNIQGFPLQINYIDSFSILSFDEVSSCHEVIDGFTEIVTDTC